MEVIYQKSNRRYRQEENMAALFFSFETVRFACEKVECPMVNETIDRLCVVFCRYVTEQFRITESQTNGIRHPIYAAVNTIVHRADKKLICVELIFSARRFQHTVFEKHLLLHFGQSGQKVLDSRLLIGKGNKCLRVMGNQAIDPNGEIYLLNKAYQN